MTEEGRAGRRLGIMAAAAVLLAGCGLPDAYYLSPPQNASTGDPLSNQLEIMTIDRTSEPEFRGYELYYKIYTSAGAVGADANIGAGVADVRPLLDAGFLPVVRGPSVLPSPGGLSVDQTPEIRSLPLIPIEPSDRSSSFTVSITLAPGSAVSSANNFTYTGPNAGTVESEIDRHAAASPSGAKPFTFGQGYYASTDPDGAFLATAAPSEPIYIGVYAVSYGLLLQDLSTPIYSTPVYLGYLQLSGFQP